MKQVGWNLNETSWLVATKIHVNHASIEIDHNMDLFQTHKCYH